MFNVLLLPILVPGLVSSAHEYVLAPLPLKVMGVPGQIELSVAAAATTGNGLVITKTASLDVQPNALVVSTV